MFGSIEEPGFGIFCCDDGDKGAISTGLVYVDDGIIVLFKFDTSKLTVD